MTSYLCDSWSCKSSPCLHTCSIAEETCLSFQAATKNTDIILTAELLPSPRLLFNINIEPFTNQYDITYYCPLPEASLTGTDVLLLVDVFRSGNIEQMLSAEEMLCLREETVTSIWRWPVAACVGVQPTRDPSWLQTRLPLPGAGTLFISLLPFSQCRPAQPSSCFSLWCKIYIYIQNLFIQEKQNMFSDYFLIIHFFYLDYVIIHPPPFSITLILWGSELEPVPAVIGREAGYFLVIGLSQIQHTDTPMYAHIHMCNHQLISPHM